VIRSVLRSSPRLRLAAAFAIAGVAAFASWMRAEGAGAAPAVATAADVGWPAYGGDDGGTRWSAAAQITPANVSGLRRQWIFRTGDAASRPPAVMRRIKFETTPILVEDRLVLCSTFNEVIALDPASGAALWRHDPKLPANLRPGNRYNCRGVVQWRDPAASRGAECALRILSATADARLIALDARTGRPCGGFGTGGEVRLDVEPQLWPGELQVSSAPVVVGDVVVVGSAIADNQRQHAPSGRVRAFDARTGAPRWSWEPLAPDTASRAGAANAWAPLSVDAARGLVFVPTSSPSPDFYGAARPGPNAHSDSVVALRAADGSLAWAFQTVKHDVWDYDVPSQPTLARLSLDGSAHDAVLAATKQGFVFVLDRATGVPLLPVEERAVPQGGAPGEVLSPTQTFPVGLPSLAPSVIRPDDAYGFLGFDRSACRRRLEALRNEGLYTPPSEQGTVLFPFTGGGVNWGGVAVDGQGVVYANTSRAIHVVRLVPRAAYDAVKSARPGRETSPQAGLPYGMTRDVLLSPLGAPCNPPPWGALAALDLKSRRILWQVPLGTTEDLLPLGLALHTGTPNFGGPVVTAGGLVFIGAALDRYLRAFDAASGAELWRGRLPAAGMATPMTYVWRGRQYVVIAAGGHGEAGVETSDAIVAFALPAPGEPERSFLDRTWDQPGGRATVRLAAIALAVAALVVAFVRLRARRRRRRGGPGV